jgi:hypothetical protein
LVINIVKSSYFLLRIKIIHQITGTVENSQKYTTDNKINVHEWGNVESRDTGNIGQLRIQRHWEHWAIKNSETLGTLGNQESRDTENIRQSRIQRH